MSGTTVTALRRKRGVIRGSITRIKNRIGDLRDKGDTTDVPTNARQLGKKLESLILEFKELHYSVLDALETEEDYTREQRTFDEVDDEITQLQIDIEALTSVPAASASATDGHKDKKTVYRKLVRMRRKLDLIARTINSEEELDSHTLLEYTTELSEHKKELQDVHEQILNLDLDETDEVCETHSFLEQLTFELSLKVNGRRGRNAADSVRDAKHTSEGVKLPKLEVPRFNGDILQWRVFWEQFNISIHSRSSLSKAEKLVYLQQSLKEGSAKGIVEGLSKTGDCYDEAIECLTARYNRPRLIHQTHVKRIMDVPPLKNGSGKELRHLHDIVQQHLRALKAMGHDPSGTFITSVLELKLDVSTMFEWQQHSQGELDVPHYSKLLEFINLRAQASESVMDYTQGKTKSNSYSKGSKVVSNKHVTSYAVVTDKSADSCVACKSDKHPLYACPKFRALPHSNKMLLLKTHSMCLNCLRSGHYANQCKSVNRCHVCQCPHHSLLHLEAKHDVPMADPSTNSNLVTSHAATELNSSVLLMTCKVLIEAPDGSKFVIRGVLDSASSASFISERIVQTLKLPRSHYKARVSGITGLSYHTTNQSIVSINISSIHLPDQKIHLSAIVVPRITCDLPVSPVMSTSKWDYLSDLPLADPTFGVPGRIDLLLGIDIFASVLLQGRRLGPPGTPAAIKTKFGWVLAGSVKAPMNGSRNVITCLGITEDINDLLCRFWEIEKCHTVLPSHLGLTSEEKFVLKHFEDNHTRSESGSFIVPLPKRDNCLSLGESRSKAVRRFLSLEKSLKHQKHQEEFYEVMEEYFRMEHAEAVPECDLEKQPESVFYLPMHAVHKNSSTTTKLRIVFDASAKTSSGVSLNDIMMVEHTVHPPLIDVILQFRLHRVAVIADISKMYRAVMLADSDKDLHRFVWRRSPDQPLRDYRMTRLTFGVSASSFAANMAVRQNAMDLSKEYPLAAAAVSTSFYVDDGLLGADSIESATELVRQSYEMFAKGGFLLRKWKSSNPLVLDALPDELKSVQVSHIVSDPTSYTKTLGIEWHSVMDHFRLSVSELPPLVDITKRALVSDVAKTYDILGWFSPTIITMKILLQKTWETGIGWDDVVSDEIRDKWFSWRTELGCLTKKHIPRCYFPKSYDIVCKQLHGFSDASESAYAAVVYFRSMDTNGNVHVSLVTAKTKVAPIKRLTIPRLELCGAQLLAHLLYHLKELFDMQCNAIYAWTDSTIVLDWLSNDSRRFKTFVGNRIADTVDHIPSKCWNHVNGSSNPADCASRGLLPSELLNHNLWWNGPEWLCEDPNAWPKGRPPLPEGVNNEKKDICLLTSVGIQSPVVDINRFSSFSKLKKVTGWIRRFIHNSRSTKSDRMTQSFLSVDELQLAENYWIQMIQEQHFLVEINKLKNGKPLPPSSSLLALCPILDEKKIVRIGGRQSNSPRPYESNHPIILHGSHMITRMIIREEHLRLMHGGPTLVHGSISRRFHIIGGHKVFRSVIRECVTCRKYSAKSQTQRMGDLPAERVTPDHPFSNVGVDYAGPFYTKYGHTRKPTIVKSYVCIFVALSIKAVHIELVSDLTSETFIAALRRFIARRGKPSLITSDNGTNFVRANKDMSDFYTFLKNQIIQRVISEFCSCNGIQWKFIPEYAPHFGGLWESAVRSMKYHLKRVIGDIRLTFEELTTLLTQVEACLNSRPLTPLTTSEEGIEVLTPGHFLIGRPIEAIPDSVESYSPISQLRRWHLVQKLNRQFWKRWSDEYLTTIRKMTKWQYPSRNIQVDDIVLIREDGLTPTKWPMARVIATHKGRDEHVRVTTVKTARGIYKRPITKLILILPVDDGTTPLCNDEVTTIQNVLT